MSNIPKIPFSEEQISSNKMTVLDANTRSLDEFMNSDNIVTQDRNGDDYPTRKQLIKNVNEAIKNIGYVISGGTFESGATLTQQNAALLYQADNQYYQWTGTLPKIVPAKSTPKLTGGISNGAWVLAGDSTLRKELSGSNGAEIIGNGDISLSESLSNLPTFNNIYDIFIIYGQSNAVGFGDVTSNPVDLAKIPDNSFYWCYINNQGSIEKQTNFMTHSSGEKSTGSAWNAFAEEYISRTGRGIIFIPCAKGATTINQLAKGGEYYTKMQASITAFNLNKNNFDLKLGNTYALFNQGETDMSNDTSKGDYQLAIKTLADNMISDFNVNSFYILLVGSPQTRLTRTWQQIQLAQIAVASANSNIKLATQTPARFTKNNGCLRSDDTHFTAKGYNVMGSDAAQNIAKDILRNRVRTNIDLIQNGNLLLPPQCQWHFFNASLRAIDNIWTILDRNTYQNGYFAASNIVNVEYKTDGNLYVKLNFTPTQVLNLNVTMNDIALLRGWNVSARWDDGIKISAVSNMHGVIDLTKKTITLNDSNLQSMFSLDFVEDNQGGYFIIKHPRTQLAINFVSEGTTTSGNVRPHSESSIQTNFRKGDYTGQYLRFNLFAGKIDLSKYLDNSITINVSGIGSEDFR